MMALVANQVQVTLDPIPGLLQQIASGKVRALAVGASQRATALPDIPTIAESGFPGFSTFTWWALGAPAGTPQSVVARINEAVNSALSSSEIRERLKTFAAEPMGGSSAEAVRFVAEETEKWREFVQRTGVTIE